MGNSSQDSKLKGNKMNLFKVYEAVWDEANKFAENTTLYYQDYALNVWGVLLTDKQAQIIVLARQCWEEVNDKDANKFFHLVEKTLESIEIESSK